MEGASGSSHPGQFLDLARSKRDGRIMTHFLTDGPGVTLQRTLQSPGQALAEECYLMPMDHSTPLGTRLATYDGHGKAHGLLRSSLPASARIQTQHGSAWVALWNGCTYYIPVRDLVVINPFLGVDVVKVVGQGAAGLPDSGSAALIQ